MIHNRFYSHLLFMNPFYEELEKIELDKKEKEHLVTIAESSMHTTILGVVVDNLPEDHKERFILLVEDGNDEEIWEILSYIEGIEKTISQIAHRLRDDLISDLRSQ